MRFLLAAAAGCCWAAAAAQVQVLLADGDLEGWQQQGFEKVAERTRYSILNDEQLDGRVIVIESDGGASGYIRAVDLAIGEESIVNVTWRLDAAVNPADERSRAGDDFPLRIYFSDSTSIGADTLTMVHSIQSDSGSRWTSPYSGMLAEFQMYAIGGRDTQPGVWHTAAVPIGRIWIEEFGELPDRIALIGFMGDSDNAGGSSSARLARIELVAD